MRSTHSTYSTHGTQRTPGGTACFLGMVIGLVLAAGCGQSEGERCQVNSDCASGLTCDATTGNGRCRAATTTSTSTATNTGTVTNTGTTPSTATYDGGVDGGGAMDIAEPVDVGQHGETGGEAAQIVVDSDVVDASEG